jgi:hypothetical protein
MDMNQNLPMASGFEPESIEALERIAAKLAASNFIPDVYKGKPGDILAAAMRGREVGLSTMQALDSMAMINGKATIFGDGYLGLIQASPAYERHEEVFTGSGSTLTAVCKFWRKGNPVPFVGSFSMADANTAKVCEKDKEGNKKWISLSEKATYKSWPREMLMWRARHRAGQAGFSDATKGLIPREIADDYPEPAAQRPELRRPMEKPIDAEARVVEPPPAELPAPAPEPAPEPEPPPPAAEAPAMEPEKTPETKQPEGETMPMPDGPKITEAQKKRLFAIGFSVNVPPPEVCAMVRDYYGSGDVMQLTRPAYDRICADLEAMKGGK